MPKQLSVKPTGLTKQTIIDAMIADVQAKHGVRSMRRLSDVQERDRTSTGIEHLDSLLGGGLPLGQISEIFGSDNSGKTSLALSIVGHTDGIAMYIDGERKVTVEQAEHFGARDETIIYYPSTIEDAFEKARMALNVGVKLVVIDSLPSLVSQKTLDEKDMGKQVGVAPTAGFLAQKLGIFIRLCDEKNAAVLIVNQNRANLNLANPYADPFHQFGGLMLPSIASVRVRVTRGTQLKPETKKFEPIGIFGQKLRYLIKKSSVGPSFGEGEIPLVYAMGFRDHTDIYAVKEELLEMVKLGAYTPLLLEEVPAEVTVEEVFDAKRGIKALIAEEAEREAALLAETET